MKLLYILGNIINRAGVERIMTQKINYLAETNCDVSLLTTDQMGQPISFPLSNKVNYISVKAPIPSRTDYPFAKWLFMFHKARSIYKEAISKTLENNRPDIIICTTYSFDVLDILTDICLRKGIKLVIESHIQLTNVFMRPRLAYNPLLALYGKHHDIHIINHIKKLQNLYVLQMKI